MGGGNGKVVNIYHEYEDTCKGTCVRERESAHVDVVPTKSRIHGWLATRSRFHGPSRLVQRFTCSRLHYKYSPNDVTETRCHGKI
jgi:hypothetical protein